MPELLNIEHYNMQTVFSIVKALIEEKNLYALLRQIHDQTKQVIKVDRCTIFIYDCEKSELWSWVSPDLEIKEIRLPVGQGIAGEVAAKKETLIVNDVASFPLFDSSWDIKTGYRTNNMLTVPMLARGSELVGVIEAINKKGENFTDYDGSLLMTFASLAAIAIRDVQRDLEKERFIESVVRSFGETIDARSEVTSGHSRRVAAYARNFGIALKLNDKELKVLYYAAFLHDVGKIGVKDAILEKPGRLTPEEFRCIKDHASYTRNILNAIDFPDEWKEVPQIAASHHEKVNGQGYPVGLMAHQIHKLAKILSIIDVYESLTARDRPYRKAMTREQALDILQQDKGINFDPELVDFFIKKRVYQIELRMHKRVNVDLAIEYIVDSEGHIKGQEIGKGRALNISRGGLLFTSDITFPFNKLVELIVYIPGGRIEALAQVVRSKEVASSEKFQVGLRFVNLSQENLQKLKKYLQIDS